jgi:predicted DNA-binding transcriptional regulator AlpA
MTRPSPTGERSAQPPPKSGHDDRLIGIREIRDLFDLGRTAAYELVHRPGFPALVPVSSHSHRWWESEVRAFAAALQTEVRRPARIAHIRPGPGTTSLRITGKMRPARKPGAPADGLAGTIGPGRRTGV